MSASFRRDRHGDDTLTSCAHATGCMRTPTQGRIPDQHTWIHRFRQEVHFPRISPITPRMQEVPTPRRTFLHQIRRRVPTALLQRKREGRDVGRFNCPHQEPNMDPITPGAQRGFKPRSRILQRSLRTTLSWQGGVMDTQDGQLIKLQ